MRAKMTNNYTRDKQKKSRCASSCCKKQRYALQRAHMLLHGSVNESCLHFTLLCHIVFILVLIASSRIVMRFAFVFVFFASLIFSSLRLTVPSHMDFMALRDKWKHMWRKNAGLGDKQSKNNNGKRVRDGETTLVGGWWLVSWLVG